MAFVPNSNSVVAFQSQPSSLLVGASIIGLTPVSITNTPSISGTVLANLQSTNASVISINQGSIAAVIVGGSVAGVANQSVSGNVGIVGNPSISGTVLVNNGSVVAFQGGAPWANTNVGSIITVNQGSIAAVIIGGSIAANFTPPVNQSVSGTVGASTIGTVPVTQVTSPWLVASSIAGGIFPISGSVAATIVGVPNVNVAGSVVSFQGGVQVTSLVSTIPSSVQVGASIMGQLPAGTAMLGSIAAYQGTVPWAVAGSVAALVTNTVTVVSSISGGIFPVSGSVAAVVTNTVAVAGSVVAFQGTSPWVVNFQNSSIIAINAGSVVGIIPGSVITVPQMSSILAVPVGSVITVFQAPSIVGTYVEDAASASGDKGIFTLNARNDTLSSVSSSDGDYTQFTVGPAGEGIVANAPFTKWVQGNASVMSSASVAVIAAQGASIFTYVTALQIANTSAVNTLVTFQGASSSIIGYAPAPANGGAVFTIPNAWKSNANGAITALASVVGSVYISASGFISKT